MDYLCKDCIYNNNGWCKKRKIQKLKEIEKCDFKDNGEVKSVQEVEEISEEKNEGYKNFGKRDLFYNMQRQIIAMEMQGKKSISMDELKSLMISLDQGLKISESIGGICFDYMLDRDIFNDSNKIIESWKSQTK